MSRVEDVVIVGAGIAGLALARELASRGLTALVLDAAAAPSSEATAKSAWMIRTDDPDEATAALARRGAEIWRSGTWGEFRATGGFLIGEGPDDLAPLIPGASGRGRFVRGDGVVEASSALLALQPERLHGGWAVEAIAAERGELVVRGPRGTVRAHVVVNAAGAWAGVLGGLPLRPLRRHVALLSGWSVPHDAPFCWDLAADFYFRPHDDGVLACACDEVDSAPGDASVDEPAVRRILDAARRLQPGLGEPRLRAAWSGQRTFAPDRRAVVGWDDRLPGLVHLAGLGGHGITLAPALAELAARLIARGPHAPVPEELEPLSPARLRA